MNNSEEIINQRISAKQGLFATIAEAVKGSQQDFTEGSIRRAIFMLAVPMVLELALESLFAVVNIAYVSHLSGNTTEAIATVGLTESLLTLVFTISIGLSVAVTALVARRIGEKDVAGASFAGAQGI